MIPAEPSRTAYRVALRRAAHQLLDLPPVLHDPLALAILRPEDAETLRADPVHYERGPTAPYLRAFLAVRARFIEDQLVHARRAGLAQYVLLGAGLDTFAYRDPSPTLPLRVWEVDHPATQAWKRHRLAEAQIPVPPSVTFVPVDFERDDLGTALAQAGLDPEAGVLFAWLGVVPYLTSAAVRSTLGYIARVTTAAGGVVFDYALAPETLSPTQRLVYDGLAARVRAAGEPFQSGFTPEALLTDLRQLGFAVAEDLTPDALNARYLSQRSDGLRVGSLAHLMWAGPVRHAT